ncbi:hypothetical protein LN577_04760, partial [Xanthomonas euvesicatoria pv. euvesicatoria]|nr:hypothetical protein [Xanthomonas euvesicatoria pv. euvesicatoria]
ATGEPTTLGFELHSPILISCSDCRSKSGGERADSLRLTEILAGTTKALTRRIPEPSPSG